MSEGEREARIAEDLARYALKYSEDWSSAAPILSWEELGIVIEALRLAARPASNEVPPCPKCHAPYHLVGAERYWEGRWRDEHATNEGLRDRLAALAAEPGESKGCSSPQGSSVEQQSMGLVPPVTSREPGESKGAGRAV